MRAKAFHEEVKVCGLQERIADHEVEEYKNTLQDY